MYYPAEGVQEARNFGLLTEAGAQQAKKVAQLSKFDVRLLLCTTVYSHAVLSVVGAILPEGSEGGH